MTLHLNSTALCPPEPAAGFRHKDGREAKRLGHWWCYIESTDAWVFGGDYAGLVEAYRIHLITNQQPVPADLDATVQELICAMVPSNWRNGCVARDAQGFRITVALDHVRRWLRTMIAYSKGGELVSQQEAETRAETCLRCRYRVPITGCKSCGTSLGGLLTQLAINRTTPVDDQLTACGVCGCSLKALIHFPNETLNRASAGLSYPSDTDGKSTPCWRLEKP